jgi:hypothetical protein
LGRAEDISFVGVAGGVVLLAFFESFVIASPTGALVYVLNNDEEARETYEHIGHNIFLIVLLIALALFMAFIGAASSSGTSA